MSFVSIIIITRLSYLRVFHVLHSRLSQIVYKCAYEVEDRIKDASIRVLHRRKTVDLRRYRKKEKNNVRVRRIILPFAFLRLLTREILRENLLARIAQSDADVVPPSEYGEEETRRFVS